jgi:DNA polymerase I-like protein with 3'-5' exonuclease and polymerase domains
LEDIKEYAAEDADVTFQLSEVFSPILDKAETKKLFDEIEIPLIPCFGRQWNWKVSILMFLFLKNVG